MVVVVGSSGHRSGSQARSEIRRDASMWIKCVSVNARNSDAAACMLYSTHACLPSARRKRGGQHSHSLAVRASSFSPLPMP